MKSATWMLKMSANDTHITREIVFEAIRNLPGVFTTTDVAERLGVPERHVRGAISWLQACMVIEGAGRVWRPCRGQKCQGARYSATAYRLTGVREIRKTPRNRDERRRSFERATQAVASSWLSMPWGMPARALAREART